MQLFTGHTSEIPESPQPHLATTAIAIEAAVASVKPSALVQAELVVSQLRDRRAELSAELGAVLAEARKRSSESLPIAATVLQKKIADLDEEIRVANSDMQQRRQAFVAQFTAITEEFRSAAMEKIRAAAPSIVEAAETFAAIERIALKAGIEVTLVSPVVRAALDTLRGFRR